MGDEPDLSAKALAHMAAGLPLPEPDWEAIARSYDAALDDIRKLADEGIEACPTYLEECFEAILTRIRELDSIPKVTGESDG